MDAREILEANGHNMTEPGMCEKCWREAATYYANGQGAYESHVQAYWAVMERAQRGAELAASIANATAPIGG